MKWFRRNRRAPSGKTDARDVNVAPAPPPEEDPSSSERPDGLKEAVIEALRTVYDPEIPVNIYDIGLVYEIDIDSDRAVRIEMTLTSPACPVAGVLPEQVETKVRAVAGVTGVQVDLVWDPPWTPDFMSEAAKLELGML